MPAICEVPSVVDENSRPSPLGGTRGSVPQPPNHPFLKEKRLFRQPDGSLSEVRPPRKPYVVAARKDWADLVHYARTNGGDENASAGRCYRYGVGVPYSDHRQFLASMGMEPETEADGSWVGFDPQRSAPLEDPHHPFHALFFDEPATPPPRNDGEGASPATSN